MRPDWGIGSALLLFAFAVLASLGAKKAFQLTTGVFLLGCGGALAALTASTRGAGWMLSMVSFLLILGFLLTQRPIVRTASRGITTHSVADEDAGESRAGSLIGR